APAGGALAVGQARLRRVGGAGRADVPEEVADRIAHGVAIGELAADRRALLHGEIVRRTGPTGVEVGALCHGEGDRRRGRTRAGRRALARTRRIVGAVAELAAL